MLRHFGQLAQQMRKKRLSSAFAAAILAFLGGFLYYTINMHEATHNLFLNGEFTTLPLDTSITNSDDSIAISIYVQPAFSDGVKLTTSISRDSQQTLEILTLRIDDSLPSTSADTLKRDHFPPKEFKQLAEAIRSYKQDSTQYMLLDGTNWQIEMLDREAMQTYKISYSPESPNAIRLQNSALQLMINVCKSINQQQYILQQLSTKSMQTLTNDK